MTRPSGVPTLCQVVFDTTDARRSAEFWRLGGELRADRSDDPDEPLRVYADPAGHTFCIFVA